MAVFLLAALGFIYFYYIKADDTITKAVHYNVEMDPDPLTETAKISSLEGYGATGALADENLSIVDMLTYAVQDEYLAHGEYEAIINKFGDQKPYSNIVLSEETHLSLLKEIYESYDMEFLEDESDSHIVIPETLLAAATTGVQAEIDNIAMYEKFLTYDLPDSIENVFIILKDGSEKHLNAFQRQVEKLS